MTQTYCVSALLLFCSPLAMSGCGLQKMMPGPKPTPVVSKVRPYKPPPPKHFVATQLPYSDDEGFDRMLQSAVAAKTSHIVINTGANSPGELEGRLLEWVAAWEEGGQVADPYKKGVTSTAIIEGIQVLNSDEFKELMGNVRKQAISIASWYKDDEIKSKRVQLLEPYVLSWYTQPNQPIQIRLYNGNYPESELPDFFHPQATADASDPALVR